MKNLDKLLADLDNPRKYVQNVNTALDYQNLPLSSRAVFRPGWLTPWYLLPASLEVKSGEFFGEESEWVKLNRFLSKKYPIQYFLRDGYRDTIIRKVLKSFQWDIEELYNDAKCWLFPRRPKLKAAIPNTYEDLTTIIPNVLFTAIIEFVEDEQCFKYILWTGCGGKNRAAKRKIKEIYQWAKTGRKELEEEISKSYPAPGLGSPARGER